MTTKRSPSDPYSFEEAKAIEAERELAIRGQNDRREQVAAHIAAAQREAFEAARNLIIKGARK